MASSDHGASKVEAVFTDLSNRLSWGNGVRVTLQGVTPTLGRLAIASVLIAAVFLGISQLGGSMDGATVAWADVVWHIAQVDYVHFYDIETRLESYSKISEGWYAHNQFRTRCYGAEQILDNGQTLIVLDSHLQSLHISRMAIGKVRK